MKKEMRLYNLIFPTFMLFAFHPILLSISLAGNFIIDSLILIIISLIIFKNLDLTLYKRTILKVWICGFIADFLGAITLTAVSFAVDAEYKIGNDLYSKIITGIYCAVNHSPFDSIWGVVYVCCGIAFSAILLFIFNYYFCLYNTSLSKKQRLFSALAIAIFTAPYTFLLPKDLFY